ncbi:LamG-like jellyroll fold domain-containing protein [Streptomyces sp. NPDC003480]
MASVTAHLAGGVQRRWLRGIALAVSGVLLVALGTQSAQAVIDAHALTSGSAVLPHQRTGSAAGLPHQVKSAALRTKGSASSPKAKPVHGALPPSSTHVPKAKERGSFRPQGQLAPKRVSPPARIRAALLKESQRKAAKAAGAGPSAQQGDPHIPGPKAGGVEVVKDRTGNTSVFRNADGTLTARVYSRPVHYRTAKGTWADIDSTLVQGSDGHWTERADSAPADFAASGNDSLLVSYGPSASEQVGYSLQGAAAVTGQASGNAITYLQIATSSDLKYSVTSSGVKETLLLHDASAPTTWVFPLHLTGLAPSLTSDGSVVFKNSKGAVRVTIPHGYMEDANIGKVSGEGATSTGVTYSLTTVDGGPALRVSLDASWLHDNARVFPVKVDPTNLNASSSTYVETPYDTNFSTDSVLKVGSYDDGSHKANSYVLNWSFGSTFKNDYIEQASLYLDDVWSGGCTAEPVYVHAITSSWNLGTIADYPGLSYGSTIGSSSFEAGASCGGSSWHGIDIGDNPSAAGVKLLEGWAHGTVSNNGLALTADNSVVAAWKQFASVNSSYPPYLSVTYSSYGADYSIPKQTYTEPTASTTGSMKVTLTNRGTASWSTSSTQLATDIYTTSWSKVSTNATKTYVTSSVSPNSSLTMTGTLPAEPPGQYYVCWDMLTSGTSFYSTYNVPQTCAKFASADTPPQIDSTSPASNVVVGSVSPQLFASGHDPDNYPGNGLTYDFQVYSLPVSGSPSLVADSGWVSTTQWTVPIGKLDWNQSYYWIVADNDGDAQSDWSDPSYFSTTVPQPLITSHLGAAADNNSGHDFDPQVGDYTTAATDAKVSTAGPALDVSRTYNSLDPRSSLLFGAGWSSRYDMSVQPDNDTSGGIVVTGADGRQERFGQNSFELNKIADTGDQTGDKVDDLVAVDQTTGKLWLYKGPDFSALTRVLVGTGGWNGMDLLTGGDVNGDGVGDLIAMRPSDGTLWMYPGTSGGGYGARVEIGTGGWTGMSDLTVTPPLGSDGKKDLVAIENSTGYLWAYPVNSDGTLGTRFQIGTGGWAGMSELIGGDFNADGHGDVVVIEASTGKLWLYPGTGSGSLGSRVQIGTNWNTMHYLAPVAGISGDAGTDLVATDKSSGVQYLYHSGPSPTSTPFIGNTRTATGMAVYTSAAGEFETLDPIAGTSAGWALEDKSGTTYTFGQPSGTAWKLTKITDRLGRAETLAYNSDGTLATVTNNTSNRALHFTWSGGHVTQVATDPATSGGSPETWTYSYSGDDLAKVCPPTSTTACTTYSYTSGSHFRSAVLDANPASYWRMAESSGTTATSEVALNEGNDNGTYSSSGVSLGAAGPLPGSPTTAASFDGSHGYASLPNGLLSSASYVSMGMWFKTSSTSGGVLFAYQKDALSNSSTPGNYTPMLYVGTSGKLYGEFWNSQGVSPVSTSASVADGQWHYVVLSGAGDTQSLYLDGSLVGTKTGLISVGSQPVDTIGSGFLGGNWPDEPHYSTSSNTGYPTYFNGQIAEAAFYTHPLGTPAIQEQYAAGTHAATELAGITLPSGKTKMAAAYDASRDRATQVTDANGGTWQLGRPATTGSGAYYRDAVISQAAPNYWRFQDVSGTQATNEVAGTTASNWWSSGPATYHSVTLGAPGLFPGSPETAASFNGTSSYVSLPSTTLYGGKVSANFSIELWFKTSASGETLFSYQSSAIGTTPSGNYTPALYIGADGHLYGQWWDGLLSPMQSPDTVNDGQWHQAVLTVNTDGAQTLNLDGKQADTRTGQQLDFTGQSTVSVGAGYLSGSWPSLPSNNPQGYFNGTIAEVSTFNQALSTQTVAAQYAARGKSNGATPVTTAAVTDPTNKTVTYHYDPANGSRLISVTNALDYTTSYSYDSSGFLATVTDPDGNFTATTHNTRGDTLSRTTSDMHGDTTTSYSAYPASGTYGVTDPRNDEPTSYADPRSTSATDTTYATSYTYDSSGNLLTSTDPDGHATAKTYTAGTESAIGGGTEPAGLLASLKDPNGHTTSYAYDSAGDLAQVTSPSGLKTTYTYDNLGRRLTQVQTSDTYPGGVTTSYTYDGQDRVLTATGPATTDAVKGTTHTPQTTYTYDDDGNTTAQAVADTTGGDTTRTSAWTYNSHDQLDSVTDPANRKTTYSYDAYGNRTAQTDANGNAYTYAYSPTGELLTTTLTNYTGDPVNPSSASSLVLDSRAYDPAGWLASDTDAMGRTSAYYYNWNHQLIQSYLANFHNPDGSTTTKVLQQDAYDAAGHLIEQQNTAALIETDYTVDPAGRVTTSVFDPYGQDKTTTSNSYDPNGNLTSQSVTKGSTTEQTDYAYDALGDVTSQTVHDGSTNLVTTRTYDQRGVLTSSTDPRGNVSGATAADYTTAFTSDAAGRLTQVTTPTVNAEKNGAAPQAIHPITFYGYDTFGDQTSVDDPDGNITTYTYDTDGEQVAVSDAAYTPPGSSTSLTPTTTGTYDADGHLTAATDADKNTTHYTYDQLGDLAQTQKPAVGGTTPTSHLTYDADGEPLSGTDPTGAVVQSTYDDLGRQVTSIAVVRQPTTTTDTTTFGYDAAGNQTSVTLPGGEQSTATYDAAGNLLTATDARSNTTQFTYDLDGRLTKTTLPDGTATTQTYDPAGRLTATANLNSSGATLATMSYGYDPVGNPTSVTDADNNTTTYTYDAGDSLAQQTEPVSSTSTITTSFGHDAAGNPTRYTDGNSNATVTTYNTLGLPESTIEASTTAFPNTADRTTTIAYDGNGNPTTITRPGGVTLTHTYDADGRLTGTSGTGAETTTMSRSFGYDADGRLTSAGAPGGTDTYNYDDRGELLSASGPSGSATFTYNSDRLLTSRTDKAGTATFTYNPDGQVATATDPATGTSIGYTYNSTSQLTSIAYGGTGNASRSLGYDAQHRLTSDQLTAPGGTTEASTSYGYDNVGHVTSQATTGTAGAASHTYGYDKAGRLTSWNNGSTTTSYGYDGAGNRTSVTSGSTTTTANYNARNQLTGTSNGSSSTTYAYTARGTLASVSGASGTEGLTYDAFDQLTKDGSTTYTHDDLGRLATVGTSTFAYDGTDDQAVSDGTETFGRGPAGDLLGINGPGGAALAYTNQHGDLTATFTAAGTALTGSTAYDPYGQTTATGGTQHDLGYQGGWTDPTSHRVATASRWYDPSTGDFTSHDATSQAPTPSVNANAYAYGNDDPLTNADPSGNSACERGGQGSSPYRYPSYSHGYPGGDSSSDYGNPWASKIAAMQAELDAMDEFYYGMQAEMDAQDSSSSWSWASYGAWLDSKPYDGELGAGISEAWGFAEAEASDFDLAAGYSSCNVTAAPPPPPPPTAKDGLRENPGKRPTGQPKGHESPHQNGTKGPGTGPSDTKPLDPKGAAPTQVTDPTAHQPTNNGTPLDNSGGCTGGLLGFQCAGGGNLLDPNTGVAYCNPTADWTAGNTCVPLTDGGEPTPQAGDTPQCGQEETVCEIYPNGNRDEWINRNRVEGPAPKYVRKLQYSNMRAVDQRSTLQNYPVCVYCGASASEQADHIYPVKHYHLEGGWALDKKDRSAEINTPGNLTGACQPCNGAAGKGGKVLGDEPGEWWPPAWPPGVWWPFGGGPR